MSTRDMRSNPLDRDFRFTSNKKIEVIHIVSMLDHNLKLIYWLGSHNFAPLINIPTTAINRLHQWKHLDSELPVASDGNVGL